MTPINHSVEIVVRNKNDRALEIKRARNNLCALVVNQLTLGQPRYTATLGRVANCLEQIKRNVVKEYGVGVVENDNAVLVTVMIQQLNQTSGANVALDDNVVVALWVPLAQALLYRKALTQTSGTRHDQSTRITNNARFGQCIKNVKTLGNASVNLGVGLNNRRFIIHSHRVETVSLNLTRLACVNSLRHIDLSSVDKVSIPRDAFKSKPLLASTVNIHQKEEHSQCYVQVSAQSNKHKPSNKASDRQHNGNQCLRDVIIHIHIS